MKHKGVNRALAVSATLILTSVILAFSQKPVKVDSVISESDSIARAAKELKREVRDLSARVTALSPAVVTNKEDVSDIRRWARKIISMGRGSVVRGKDRFVSVPTPVSKPGDSNRVIVVKKFEAKTIPGTPTSDIPSYFTWKEGRGLLQKKDSHTYNKIFKR